MISMDKVEVLGWEAAIRGMRNPMNSWNKSDSYMCDEAHCSQCQVPSEGRNCSRPDGFVLGENDIDLMKRLTKAGQEHRKFLRMVHVQMDITAPLYWWKEYDTYKIGTVSNSCSTMHKIHAKEFTIDDFSHEHLYDIPKQKLIDLIEELNFCRWRFLKTKDKADWWQMIQLLPSSYNQKRTVDISYEVVMTIIHQRIGHKLDEWRKFIEVLEGLPCVIELMGGEDAHKH